MALKSKAPKSTANPFFPYLPESKKGIWEELHHLIYFAAALILMLALLSYSPSDPSWNTWSNKEDVSNWMGRLGSFVSDLSFLLLGLSSFCLPLLLLVAGIKKQADESSPNRKVWHLGALLLVLSVGTLLQYGFPHGLDVWDLKMAGGLTGQGVSKGLHFVIGWLGTLILSIAAFLSAIMIVFEWEVFKHGKNHLKLFFRASILLPFILISQTRVIFRFVLSRIERIKRKRDVAVEPRVEEGPLAPTPAPVSASAPPSDPIQFGELPKDEDFAHATKTPKSTKAKQLRMPLANRNFELPSLDYLSGKSNRKGKAIDKNWFVEKGELLVEKLADFGVEGEIVNVAPGPVITVYEFKPASGIKIREIANLSDDLTLALSVLSVRIVAPIPGKPVVGIEIPTPEREMVYFKDIIQETSFYANDRRIPIALGRLASGEPILADLASMPHLLVAGATGTGKSVFVNTLISSLLYRFAPQQLKLILVDPKMVELSHYDGIPHLMLPVVVDAKKAVLALRWLVDEMERRYKMLHQFGVRHVDGYNAKLNELHKKGEAQDLDFLPYIVNVIDEYADLMAVVAKDVEHSVARLAQKARAAGIHLVLATQRPSTDVVTGTIKANFPSRISFRVASGVDSKTILDRPGAERLLGNGDMLFHSAGFNSLKRMQGSFLEDQDLDRVIEHLKSQSPPQYDENILAEPESEESDSDSKEGELYDQAVRLVTERGEASISLIQRHLRIGYNRAATLMEQMEKEGIVGASTGASKRRAVLVNSL